jgi:hypothetical protein
MKKVCCECKFRCLDKKDSFLVDDLERCWKCERKFWQDQSICLHCDGRHSCRDWAMICSQFEWRD